MHMIDKNRNISRTEEIGNRKNLYETEKSLKTDTADKRIYSANYKIASCAPIPIV